MFMTTLKPVTFIWKLKMYEDYLAAKREYDRHRARIAAAICIVFDAYKPHDDLTSWYFRQKFGFELDGDFVQFTIGHAYSGALTTIKLPVEWLGLNKYDLDAAIIKYLGH